jgi:hypothetical protein
MLFPGEDAMIVRSYLRAIGREEEVIAGHLLAGRGGRIIDVYRYDLSNPAAGITAAEFKWPTAQTSER